MSNLEKRLRERKLKITPQRLEVLRAIQKIPPHPSAEAIYRSVKRRCPSVSLATVYKTLETLVQIGVLRVAIVSNGKTLFDTRLEDHHHFLCTECGFVEDVDINLDCLETCAPHHMKSKHQVVRSEVVFRGLCRRCSDAHGDSISQNPVIQ